MTLAPRLLRPAASASLGPRRIFSGTVIFPKSAFRSNRFTTSTVFRSAESTVTPPSSPASFAYNAVKYITIATLFTTTGFVIGAMPALQAAQDYVNPPTDAETLTMFTPANELEREIEEFIQTHPITLELRSKSEISESRPHLKVPEAFKKHNLTAGILLGPGRVAVPPFFWNEEGGKSMVSIAYLGEELCGHPGIVHGGFLATMLDEGLARCCFGALPNKIAMTANLNINYKSPTPAGTYVVLRAKTTKVEGRKAWVEGHIETLVAPGEKPVILAEASGLFIEPRTAATMTRIYPVK